MRIGVKSEIHSCTISFMKNILKDYFSDDEIELVEKSQKARIDIQYYSDRNISDDLYNRMVARSASFMVTCKEIANNLNEADINSLRSKLQLN